MRPRKLIVIFIALLLLVFSGCVPARKPLPPVDRPDGEQRPRPIPTPRNVESQVFVDDFITGTVLSMPGVKQAGTLLIGNVAVVGVKFDNSLSNDRQKAIRRDISKKVLALKGINDALITSEPDKVRRIEKVSGQLRNGRSIRDAWNDINILMNDLMNK